MQRWATVRDASRTCSRASTGASLRSALSLRSAASSCVFRLGSICVYSFRSRSCGQRTRGPRFFQTCQCRAKTMISVRVLLLQSKAHATQEGWKLLNGRDTTVLV